ncbi:hypothetical protein A3D14_03060 [Candidatus Saccharibacteria bacterium RIFCSPHIGHO2_02_FULL_47_12]|nr:MAG: hypothetical protein A3D14_03060 [Candidatus Saccharibacteria bacterium RIFCSPHIGHO2_02_FULL_47_12]
MSGTKESDPFDHMAPERDLEGVRIAEIGDVITAEEMGQQPPGTWVGAGKGKWRLVGRIIDEEGETTSE